MFSKKQRNVTDNYPNIGYKKKNASTNAKKQTFTRARFNLLKEVVAL